MAVMAVSLCSCRQHGDDVLNPDSTALQEIESYVDLFDIVWNGINSSYVFWDVDSVNWDKRYEECLPLFKAFDDTHEKGDTVHYKQYREAWSKVVAGLTDHHLYASIRNLYPVKGEQEFVTLSPGSEEVKSRVGYHPSSENVIEAAIDTMVQDGRISDISIAYGYDTAIYVLSCLMDSSIAYFRSNSFYLTEMKEAAKGTPEAMCWKVFESWKRLIADKATGAILDVRANGGGYCSDLGLLLSPFLAENLTIGRYRTKQGMGRMDYSPWSDMVCPASATTDTVYDIPLVVICDCGSVSMAEMTAYAVSQMPKGVTVGERTYGATGPLAPGWYEGTFGGVFGTMYSNYYVYTSTFEWHTPEGCLEGIGVTPDVYVPFDSIAFSMGVDPQIEAALLQFKNN